MGVSISGNIMRDFGTAWWGEIRQLKTARFTYRSNRRASALYVAIDARNFRFAAENWIHPNQNAYRTNQIRPAVWRIYDVLQRNEKADNKYSQMLSDFIDELNEFFIGDHAELQVTFVWKAVSESYLRTISGDNVLMPNPGLSFTIAVPHAPSS